jgi:hypothetical protein
VYTESPHWQPYIEQHWLPRWEARMVLFNRSRPWSKDQVEARLWRSVHRYGEHTPLAIIIPRGGTSAIGGALLGVSRFQAWKAATAPGGRGSDPAGPGPNRRLACRVTNRATSGRSTSVSSLP